MNGKVLRILAIGAHPDDCDILLGGTAIKYAKAGHKVKFISATNGNTGHQTMGGGELARRRYNEAQRAASVAGIEYEFFDIHNNGIQADIATREMFIKAIREFHPDILFTHRTNDYHPDHRITAMLVQDTSYSVMIPNVCPLTPVMRTPPVIMFFEDRFKKPYEFEADIVIDIDDVYDTKARMFACHESQVFEWLPYVSEGVTVKLSSEAEKLEWVKENSSIARKPLTSERFRDRIIERYGKDLGEAVKRAEAFEISEYGRIPDQSELNDLFPF